MIRDIVTVMWKERNALFIQPRSRLRLAITFLLPLGLSIWMPLQAGADWFNGYVEPIIVCFVLPLLTVSTMIPDSFAGERERKTLETLLASRLPDRAILFGKLAIAIAYGWAATIIALVIGAVVANIARWGEGVGFYAARVLIAALCAGFLVSTLTASLGVLVSLRAKGVQEAQQILSMAILLPPMIAGFVLMGLRDRLPRPPSWLTAGHVVVIALAVVALLSLVLIWLDVRRFRRDRLVLD